MQISDNVLVKSEKVSLALRELFANAGYGLYRMSKFEEYDLYAGNKDFLVSDNVITFTDTGGKLMALKPDVTLSLIKNSPDLPRETKKLFYSENVYRVSEGSGNFREIMQTGLECFGKVGEAEILEVVRLAAESLRLLAPVAVLDLSDLTILEELIRRTDLSAGETKALYKAVSQKNAGEAAMLTAGCADREAAELLLKLIGLAGPLKETLPALKALLAGRESAEAESFIALLEALAKSGEADMLRLDFSVVSDPGYYNGLVFKGFLQGLPQAVISGGQYDKLMRKFRRQSSAVGFAVYTDLLDGAATENTGEEGSWLNVALPKGRLGDKVYGMLAAAGFDCPAILEQNRKLVFENPEKKLRYFWVKPSDVAVYVERGAADVGIAGKDILLEHRPDVYELLDMKTGICRMCVAAPESFTEDPTRPLRVATKFAEIARSYYRKKGRDIDIIPLNGSIEIAPILGLSDVIVDIVETGTTLRENHLKVREEIVPISARLIANKAASKFKAAAIDRMSRGLAELIGGK